MPALNLKDGRWIADRPRYTPIAPLAPMEESRIPVVERRDAAMDEADLQSTVRTIRNYLPESVGALKCEHKEILSKLDELLAGIRDLDARLDRLEDTQ